MSERLWRQAVVSSRLRIELRLLRSTGATRSHPRLPQRDAQSLERHEDQRWYSSSSPSVASPENTSSIPQDMTRPLKRNPYRLVPLKTFLVSFAPLHVSGWRLVNLSSSTSTSTSTSTNTISQQSSPNDHSGIVEKGVGTLEGKKLVRIFGLGRETYGKAVDISANVIQAAIAEQHHPSMTLCPLIDYANTYAVDLPSDTEHVLEITTYTHTPLPESRADDNATGGRRKPQPGVTGKDLRLAEEIERLVPGLGL
ncbi:hypothetical protein BD324DRAFT_616407 [Kockovaella imperatae]|uniref:Uncharacterized protein n=1 Tax=Kockovaella imperatae TaxID=4999 RepID=A0A1Y1UQ12_9TREE|nr:hypothetical protein BD324DRAFT_616407 [Kockovaella imperatae]ORX40121.1 hypothetical protein BD324DRAFT_616407 [Kockovaella imperatae]